MEIITFVCFTVLNKIFPTPWFLFYTLRLHGLSYRFLFAIYLTTTFDRMLPALSDNTTAYVFRAENEGMVVCNKLLVCLTVLQFTFLAKSAVLRMLAVHFRLSLRLKKIEV